MAKEVKVLVACGSGVATSTIALSDSSAISIEPCYNISLFFCSILFVKSVTAFCAPIACLALFIPNANTIWFFHNGIVFVKDP